MKVRQWTFIKPNLHHTYLPLCASGETTFWHPRTMSFLCVSLVRNIEKTDKSSQLWWAFSLLDKGDSVTIAHWTVCYYSEGCHTLMKCFTIPSTPDATPGSPVHRFAVFSDTEKQLWRRTCRQWSSITLWLQTGEKTNLFLRRCVLGA